MAKKIPARLNGYFQEYASCHQNSINKLTHYIGIPLILTSLLGLLSEIQVQSLGTLNDGFLRFDGGVLLWFAAIAWYCFLDWKLALPFSLVGAGCYFISREITFSGNLALFIGGWILQFIGHGVFEKKSPAFLKNLEQLLIGPLWLFAKTIGYGK